MQGIICLQSCHATTDYTNSNVAWSATTDHTNSLERCNVIIITEMNLINELFINHKFFFKLLQLNISIILHK